MLHGFWVNKSLLLTFTDPDPKSFSIQKQNSSMINTPRKQAEPAVTGSLP